MFTTFTFLDAKGEAKHPYPVLNDETSLIKEVKQDDNIAELDNSDSKESESEQILHECLTFIIKKIYIFSMHATEKCFPFV